MSVVGAIPDPSGRLALAFLIVSERLARDSAKAR